MTQASTFAGVFGQISGLAVQAALACERDLAQIEQDEQLFARVFLVGDLAGMPLEDAVARVRGTKGHPLRPLLDWWDSPDFRNVSAGRQLKQAETLMARREEAAAKEFSVENMVKLAFAKARFRRIARLYGGEQEIAHQRRMRGTGITAARAVPPAAKNITKVMLNALSPAREQLIVAASMNQVSVEDVFATLGASADAAERTTDMWLCAYLEQDEPRTRINKLAAAIQNNIWERRRQLAPGNSVQPVTTSATTAATGRLSTSDNVEAKPERQVVEPKATASELPQWPEDVGNPRSDAEQAKLLLEWLVDPHPNILKIMARLPDGKVRLTESPRAPRIKGLFEGAIDHPDVQRRLRELVPAQQGAS